MDAELSLRDRISASPVTRAAVAFLLIVVIGTCGFYITEQWSAWQSLFFTLVTITTVGYGDYGLSQQGEKVAAVLIICGIGIFTYATSQIVQSISDAPSRCHRQNAKRVKAMKDHYVVCGFGRVGRSICHSLGVQRLPFIVIDPQNNEAILDFGYSALEGDATRDEVLVSARITEAKGLIAATPSDIENLVITIAAHDLNPNLRIIARAEDPESIRRLRRAGASDVVSPLSTSADRIAQMITNPSLASMLGTDSNAGLGLHEATVEEGSPLQDNSIIEIGKKHADVVFVAIRDEAGNLNPRPSATRVFQMDDVLVFAANSAQAAALVADAKAPKAKAA